MFSSVPICPSVQICPSVMMRSNVCKCSNMSKSYIVSKFDTKCDLITDVPRTRDAIASKNWADFDIILSKVPNYWKSCEF